MRQEEAVFFPTYGFLEGSTWTIPVRVKVQEPRDVDPVRVGRILDALGIGNAQERANYMTRVADFLADDESFERVRVRFDADPERRTYDIVDAAGGSLRTGPDGIVDGLLRVESQRAQQIRLAQGATDGWLTFAPASDEHSGRGRVQLIESTGISVVSDIDDTIKITEVPAGFHAIARNTFCRDFVPAMELADRYTSLQGAAFHYVSGGPWQLYRPLAAFMTQSRWPEGSFHMRVIGGSVLTASRSLEALGAFVSPDGTFNHKVEQISRLMTRFPGRTFVLIGDSGERDPEVYQEIRSRFPGRVQEIIIRDVVNAREKASHRVQGMTVVQAPTIG
jgi:hypothetical protein